ncbi:PHO85 protein, putative [Trichomonas vaginalis G3]|uniref:PHO85 protein, putative n=1 Tax=Trichomonas vaginalis (strain ATCC PRA-98 / G3) TaxID=412133 RepID=A2FCX3_TRIV3|nr:spectrin binding [Trichomonas vaginalis G3]EAX97259.1 PHO85 protein, putative [Trichomonas vaginalis G3]KAI5535826.1 spectrin binding [Trichomonas vaginalis G3]|eukprot:XP_001310189.1 PHO85 protein [Trichomonas vaginalis G3]
MDKECLRDIVRSHNNEMLEFVLDRNLFTCQDFDGKETIYEDIIKYQNLKAVFLLFEKERNFIVPWCAAFPQTIDILKNEKLPDKIDFRKRNILHYASMSQNSDIFKFLFNSTKNFDVNYQDEYNMTALHYAAMYNNIEAARILISHGADFNTKITLFYLITIIVISHYLSFHINHYYLKFSFI